MKFQFISNACGIFISDEGKKILTDPWVVDGVFEGSWCHFHKLETRLEDLQDIDAIYVSHIHPDHYDDRFFKFDKEIPILVLDHKLNFLHKNLEDSGYKNLIKVKDKESVDLEGFKVTLFSPFVTNNYFELESKIGNLIDSAMVIESDGAVAFNANDNTPNVDASRMLRERFGKIDLAMMNYNAAGPYPSCFNNLTKEEKIKEHYLNLERNIEYLSRNIMEMNPKYFLPFAGAYVLGGSLSYKNEYLGTMTWDECITKLEKIDSFESKFICLREKDVFDINEGTSNNVYKPIDIEEMDAYIRDQLSNIKYPYESDDEVDSSILLEDLLIAKEKMLERCKKIRLIPDMDIFIKILEENVQLTTVKDSKGTLSCSLDLRLLRRILDRKAHWNNAEIGCHIEFERNPNYYSPDIHTMLQFLHL